MPLRQSQTAAPAQPAGRTTHPGVCRSKLIRYRGRNSPFLPVSFPRSMKRFRLLGYAIAALALLLGMACAVAFNASFQTWAARRALAGSPTWRGTIGAVEAGWRSVRVRDLRLEREGLVITVPAIEAELPVWTALWDKRLEVTRLEAKGWTVDLTPAPAKAAAAAVPSSSAATDVPAGQSARSPAAFEGMFSHLQLPLDLTRAEGIHLEGEVISPALHGKAKVTARGGGIGAGREGALTVIGSAVLRAETLRMLEVQGAVNVAMDTPRSFQRLSARLESRASGREFPNGITLTVELAGSRAAAGETYAATLATSGRALAQVQAEWLRATKRWQGTWKLDLAEADLASFALGQLVPGLVLAGAGQFESGPDLALAHASGRLQAAVQRAPDFERISFSRLGAMAIAADFDVMRRGDAIVVTKLDAHLAAEKPVARVQALQPFEFNPRSRTLLASEPSRDLATISLEGLPIAWAQVFVPSPFGLSGEALRGRFALAARSGGVTLRAETPLTAANLSLAGQAGPLLEAVDLAAKITADYAPGGWQVEVADCTLTAQGAEWLRLEAKAGRLAGRDEPIKTTGSVVAALPALVAQPALRDFAALARGRGAMEFAATRAAKTELQAKISLQELAVTAADGARALPAVALEVRADLAPGRVEISAPLTLTAGDRRSDLALSGTLMPKDRRHAIDARLTGTRVFVEDLRAFAAVMKPASPPAPAQAAPWANFVGQVAVQLGRVVYAPAFEATEVTGTVRIEEGAAKLELVRAGLREGGEAKLNGELSFEAGAAQPFALSADVAFTDFEVGPVLQAAFPHQPPVVEGRFNLSGRIVSRARALGALVPSSSGDLEATSRGGTFRGLPVNVSHLVENQSKIAAWIASASATISSIAGKRDEHDVASKVQAASELAKGLYPLPYDQLSVVISRDASRNAQLKDFTLISPEVRLAGSGRTTHQSDAGLLSEPLAMEFSLRAQGRAAQMLKYLGALEPQKDNLGYAACTMPIKIGGTIGRPDGTELSNRVVALVLGKSGFIDKAMELFGKPRGKQASAGSEPR